MCTKIDERLQTTQEALSAIKVIKMYSWEKFFVDRITKARKYATNNLWIRVQEIVLGRRLQLCLLCTT